MDIDESELNKQQTHMELDKQSPSEAPLEVETKEKMAGIFSSRSSRKGTSSSSSGSSENTPLLNGSQEGPCYAYSYGSSREENIVDSISSVSSCEENEENRKQFKNIMKNIKITILIGIMLFCMITLNFIKINQGTWSTVTVTSGKPSFINITKDSSLRTQVLYIKAKGPFLPRKYYDLSKDMVELTTIKRHSNGTAEKLTSTWTILMSSNDAIKEEDFVVVEREFIMVDSQDDTDSIYQLIIDSNKVENITLSVNAFLKPEVPPEQIIMAVGVLFGLYILLIFDLVHRTLAAIIGATTAVACLVMVGERPTLDELLSWIDIETLSLLLGMMILTSILCETGLFDFISILAYKLAKGRTWSLVSGLCLTTAILSAFLDNVATIILMTAVTIRLSEAMNIDPKHLLIAVVVFSNVGGTATALGSTANAIITENKNAEKDGISIGNLTLHLFPAAILSIIVTYGIIRFTYRDASSLRFSDPTELVEIKNEIAVWKKSRDSLSGYSRDEDTVRAVLERKILILETLLRKKLYDYKVSDDDYRASLKELSNTFKPKNSSLLIKSTIVSGIVIILLLLENFPQVNLSIGWVAILGAISLLILADFEELESVFSRVEWSTLLLFSALSIFMKALSKLKLTFYIVKLTEYTIRSVPQHQQLLVAIILILWISAFVSSFISSIPFTTVMLNSVAEMAENADMSLPFKPLVYALALGTCLGGNGTLIGGTTNIVAAGLSEQHGYRFSFKDFFMVGFPVMISTVLISTAYLLLCHIAFQWNV